MTSPKFWSMGALGGGGRRDRPKLDPPLVCWTSTGPVRLLDRQLSLWACSIAAAVVVCLAAVVTVVMLVLSQLADALC